MNISSEQLNNFVQDLCSILQQSYWDRPNWKELKTPVTQLCESIAVYVEYLSIKNKKAKSNHKSPTPVRDLGSNLRIKLIPVADCDIPTSLTTINDRICDNPEYIYLHFLSKLCSPRSSEKAPFYQYSRIQWTVFSVYTFGIFTWGQCGKYALPLEGTKWK